MRFILSIPIVSVICLLLLLGCRLYMGNPVVLYSNPVILPVSISISSFVSLWVCVFVVIFAVWQICKAVYNYKKHYNE